MRCTLCQIVVLAAATALLSLPVHGQDAATKPSSSKQKKWIALFNGKSLDGWEAQVDSTHSDPIRTGSLYGFCHVYKQHVKPDTWFTYDIEVSDDVWRGREMTRIKITIDGNELYEYMDFAKTYGPGHFAFQQHDPGSKVHIRKAEVLPLDE